MFPIAVQLFSLRDMMQPGYEKEDFLQVLKFVADCGYKGVQPAGFWGYTPAELTKIVEDLGMKMASSHSPTCRSLDDVAACIDAAEAMHCKEICSGFGAADYYKDLDTVKRTAELVNQVTEAFNRQGYEFYMHNHTHEFVKFNGRIVQEIMAELCPNTKFEIDAYWASNFRANDAAEMVRRFRSRCILLHLKDGTLTKGINMLPLGTGSLNIPEIIKACDPTVNKWVIVELDNCCIDMMRAIRMSYRYMIKNGLAAGNK